METLKQKKPCTYRKFKANKTLVLMKTLKGKKNPVLTENLRQGNLYLIYSDVIMDAV